MNWNWGMLPFVVVLLAMVWRVWRLEDRCRDLDDSIRTEAMHRTSADNQRTLWSYHAEIHTRVAALAHALGYEWKRTEAKEGWERKGVFGDVKWSSPPTELNRSTVVYYGNIPRYTADRRKADRRKPVEPPKAAARTGAKRGPQRRATH